MYDLVNKIVLKACSYWKGGGMWGEGVYNLYNLNQCDWKKQCYKHTVLFLLLIRNLNNIIN